MEPTDTECRENLLDQNDLCDFNPEFAVICSFIEQFGDKIELQLDIDKLKNSIENQENIDNYLIDIHVKLIKKIRRYFVRDKWEKALIRFASEYSYEDAYEIERLGYVKTKPSLKLELLRRLLDAQFECDQKFKALINSQEANELRLQPTGRDLSGNTYWHNTDKEGNFRVFQEEPLDYKSWKVICKTPKELDELIENLESNKGVKLKGEPKIDPYNPLPEIFPDLFVAVESPDEIENAPKTNRCKSSKKVRARGKVKKLHPLSTLTEEKEERNIESVPGEQKNDHDIKSELSSFPASSQSTLSADNSLVESQVRQTVEGIINKVVSSIDYFLFKPLKRNFTDSVNQVDEEKDVISKVPTKGAQKKRQKGKKPIAEELPRRSSSRIQQLQQKKEQEELKKIIELSKKVETLEDDKVNDKANDSGTNDSVRKHFDGNEQKKTRKRDRQRWRESKRKKKRSWDKDDSDLSSTSSSTGTEDDEDPLSENDPTFNVNDNDNEDDEFACEEEDTTLEPVIIKRARTARQSVALNDDNHLDASSILEEDKPCGRCDKSNDPDCILLCDMCDDGYHLTCCIPPLMIVPDGDWFCPSCEHKTLLTKLKEIQTKISRILEEKERERMKRERLRVTAAARRQALKEERARDEIVPDRRKRNLMLELNEPIALQELDQELVGDKQHKLPIERSQPRRPRKKSKKRRRSYEDDNDFVGRPRKTYSRRQLESDEETEEDDVFQKSSPDDSYESDRPKTRRARACVSYKFKEYDELIKSAIRGESGEDDLSDTKDSEPEVCNYGKGKDMATIEALAYQQENGLLEQVPPEVINTSQKPRSQSRRKGRRLNDLDAESEIDDATSDESFQATSAEEEEDEITEVDSEVDFSFDEIISSKYSQRPNRKNKWKKKRKKVYYDSDESSEYETKTRRAAARQVSYRESTDDEDFLDEPKKTKKYTLSSDEDSEEWKSSGKSEDEALSEGVDQQDEINKSYSDEIVPKISSVNQVSEGSSVSATPAASEAVKNSLDVPSGSKRIRLEKRETRPVYTMTNHTMNDSLDEITIPPSPVALPKPKASATRSPVLVSAPDSTTSNVPEPTSSKVSNLKSSCASGINSSRTTAKSFATLSTIGILEPTPATTAVAQREVAPKSSGSTPTPALSPVRTSIIGNSIPIPVQHMGQPLPIPSTHLLQHNVRPMSHMYHHQITYQAPLMTSPNHPMPPQLYTSVHGGHPMPPPPIATHPILRSPIGELDHYCNQSAYPTNIFNSFNINVPPKNLAPPHPAPFYREDEVRPPPASSADRQRTW